MPAVQNKQHSYRQILQIASPIIALQLLSVLAGFIDSSMLARLGNHALAANALGYRAYLLVLVLGGGLFMASGVRMATAQKISANKLNQQSLHAFWLAASIGCFGCVALSWLAPQLFIHSAQNPSSVAPAIAYLHWLGLASLLFLVSGIARQYCLVRAYSWDVLWIAIIYSGSHIILSYNLILGHGPITTALGVKGAGISEFLSLAISLVVTILFCCKQQSRQAWRNIKYLPQWRAIKSLLAFSWPVSSMLLGEMAAVMLLVLWLGHFGTQALAAYQIVAELGMIALMLPYGLEMATGIIIAESVAKKNNKQNANFEAQQHILTKIKKSLTIALLSMLPISLIFIFAGTWLFQYIFHYNAHNHPETLLLAKKMLIITAVYQLFDATRKTLLGALRGAGDVFIPMLLSLAAFWLIGCPLAYCNQHTTHLGPLGVWLGMFAAMSTAAILIVWRSYHVFLSPQLSRKMTLINAG